MNTNYKPEKTGWWGTSHVWLGDMLFLIASAMFLYIGWKCRFQYDQLDPSGAIERFGLGKEINFILFAFNAVGLLRVLDRMFGGNLKRGIAHDPLACGIFASVVFLTCGLVWIYFQ